MPPSWPDHFERGRDHPRAVQYRQHAAENALQRCAYKEAVEHLTTALTVLASLPETPTASEPNSLS